VSGEFYSDDQLLEVYHQTIRPLYAYVSRRVGGNRMLAEDLVQDTWMRALEAWPARGRPREPLAWLIRVAHNTVVSYYRRAQPESIDPASIDLESPAPLPDDSQAASLVSCGLARLRRTHADLLEAFYFDGKSVRDIARARALSERAVEGRLRRARARLRTELDRLARSASATRSAAAGRITNHAGHTRTP
jgi:RNA polymerase sigma-70 factor, ECF subfamily